MLRNLTASVLLLAMVGVMVDCSPNLLTNGDFETDSTFTDQTAGWYTMASSASLDTDSYTGDHSVKVFSRTKAWAGLLHKVVLEAEKNYVFSGYIKLLSTGVDRLTEAVKVILMYSNSQTYARKFVHIAKSLYMQANIWQTIGADFKCLPGYDQFELFIQLDTASVDFLLDTTSLTELPSLPDNWAATANTTIDEIRKADLNIVVTSGSGSDVTVELRQKTSEFAFGSAVSSVMIVDSHFQKYQEFFDENFEWGVNENMLKWKHSEYHQGQLYYDWGVNAVDRMLEMGKKVRGHTVFWGLVGRDPLWVEELEGQELADEMSRRIDDVTSRTLGKLEHWDVNNENVHGNMYEEALGEVNATMDIFVDVHNADPKPKLFLNDFGVVSDSRFTQAYVNQAKLFKDTPSTNIYGIGIQSHLNPPLDLTQMKHRLDALASVGLPLWITELDIKEPDTEKLAELLEDVLTLYFSHPAVEGIMLWGFWDRRMWIPQGALANGDDVTPNAAGLKWQQLVRQAWRTNVDLSLDTGSSSIRAFKGDYTLKVMRGETELETREFTLCSDGATINIEL